VSVLEALEMAAIPVVGLAKRNEELYLPGRPAPVQLPEGSMPLRVLQYIRDEAHRFATGYRAGLQTREIVTSSLESIPGIGPQRARRLLSHFSSLESIVETPEDIIAGSTGLSLPLVRIVQEHLRRSLDR